MSTTSEGEPASLQRELATGVHVRKVLFASGTRVRNLSVMTSASASALVMVGLGMFWSGLGILGFGTMLYSVLVTRDAVSEKFLSRVLAAEKDQEPEIAELSDGSETLVDLNDLDGRMREVYRGVLSRHHRLQEQLHAGPALVLTSLPDGAELCETLLVHAQRLVLRGKRLYAYLECTKLTDLNDNVASVALRSERSKDFMAGKIYQQVVSNRQRHIQTHLEIEGLYDRVIAQLLLIDTTLAGTIARIVKIKATDDEESSMTASLVSEQLELLLTDIKILESSIDEVSLDDIDIVLDDEDDLECAEGNGSEISASV